MSILILQHFEIRFYMIYALLHRSNLKLSQNWTTLSTNVWQNFGEHFFKFRQPFAKVRQSWKFVNVRRYFLKFRQTMSNDSPNFVIKIQTNPRHLKHTKILQTNPRDRGRQCNRLHRHTFVQNPSSPNPGPKPPTQRNTNSQTITKKG